MLASVTIVKTTLIKNVQKVVVLAALRNKFIILFYIFEDQNSTCLPAGAILNKIVFIVLLQKSFSPLQGSQLTMSLHTAQQSSYHFCPSSFQEVL